MMNRRIAVRHLLAGPLWAGCLFAPATVFSVPILAEEKKAAPQISIKEKWHFAAPRPMVRGSRNGIVSPDERYYLRRGAWSDLKTGKELGTRENGFDGFYTQKNHHPIVVDFDRKEGRFVSLWNMKMSRWLLPRFKVDGRIENVVIASEKHLLLQPGPGSSDDEALLVLNIPQQKIVARIPYPRELGGNHLAVSANGERVAVMLWSEGKARVWRLSDGKRLSEVKAPWADMTSANTAVFSYLPSDVAISRDLKYLAYKAPDLNSNRSISEILEMRARPISVIELATGKPVRQFTGAAEVGRLQFSKDNEWLFSQWGVQLWDMDTGKNLVASAIKKERLPAHLKHMEDKRPTLDTLLYARFQKIFDVRFAAVSPDGKSMAIFARGSSEFGMTEPQVLLLSIPEFEILASIKVSGDLPYALHFSPNGTYLIGECNLRSIVWEISDQKL